MNERTTVLVIDDDPGIHEFLQTLAMRKGYAALRPFRPQPGAPTSRADGGSSCGSS